MMKWLTKGTSVEVHTIGHQEVIPIREKRRNDKYAQLHTIIEFLHYVVFFFSSLLLLLPSAADEVVLWART